MGSEHNDEVDNCQLQLRRSGMRGERGEGQGGGRRGSNVSWVCTLVIKNK